MDGWGTPGNEIRLAIKRADGPSFECAMNVSDELLTKSVAEIAERVVMPQLAFILERMEEADAA